MSDQYIPVERLKVTEKFEELSDWIWDEVHKWPRLAQNTIGEQLLNAADFVGANLVEGGNREGDPDALRFFVFARGSAAETAYWLRRAIKRKVVDEREGTRVLAEWESAQAMLAKLISYRRSTKWKVRETSEPYGTSPATESRTDERIKKGK